MKKRRTRIVNTKWVAVDSLIIPAYYSDLFPLPRDRSALVESFERESYRPEYPLTVRPSEMVDDYFEIVCGVGRYTVARERGMRRVPVVVREMTAEEALLYAAEDNLFAAGSSASITLPQALFLSRLLEGCGRGVPPKLVARLAKVSESTFWRAVKAFDFAAGKAAGEYPALEDVDAHHRVAEMLRRDLFPDFTKLWTGALEVNSFHQAHANANGGRKGTARKGSTAANTKKLKGTRRAPAAPESADRGHSPRPAKRPSRNKDGRAESSLPLFES
ncbi:MAG TPA: ParB/RepB/Spo0J family partition protein [Pyrinomonadaceae bacterium]|nr:ParB/RepB/Spo0J family partition protein [Pyrinomonadaceae bacterium]